ncbi:MAG: hypothetical protein CYPHOPRED_005025 [Cyphobasidiales sp. Tagirdzhanova-0007]|nr:MAG: hypothetical protein CYPHOPRED_005025 [Cyphobasidiales sp. Tagirdzhanova-0007]
MTSTAQSNSQLKRLKLQAAHKRLRQESSKNVTAFRSEELYWKNRAEHPDWANAFTAGCERLQWHEDSRLGDMSSLWTDRHGIKYSIRRVVLQDGKICMLFEDWPGLILLPGYLSIPEQQSLITACLHETTGPACRTNLDTHYNAPSEGWWKLFTTCSEQVIQPRNAKRTNACAEFANWKVHINGNKRVQVDLPAMNTESFGEEAKQAKTEAQPSESVEPAPIGSLIRKLRWAIIGVEYHWGTKSYKWDQPAMPMPARVSNISRQIVQSMHWASVFSNNPNSSIVDYDSWKESYRAEAGVVNFYQFRDSLTAHIDQSEVDSVRPLISLSLGESAIFLVGGTTRDKKPIAFMLDSGDALVMSGESRRIFHGIPRIIEDRMNEALLDGWKDTKDGANIRKFIRGTRVNINVRQVFKPE